MKYSIIGIMVLLLSCNWAKQKTKDTANKAGEVVAKAGSEFADGVAKGVEKTFENELKFSDELVKKGLKSGKVLIHDSDSATDNILSVYLMYDKNIEQQVTVKIYDEAGLEYGRVNQIVKGNSGEARYVDFIFDKRTHLNGKGGIRFE